MLKVLSEKEKQEMREAIARWCKAAKATAERDEEFREALASTPFQGLVERHAHDRDSSI